MSFYWLSILWLALFVLLLGVFMLRVCSGSGVRGRRVQLRGVFLAGCCITAVGSTTVVWATAKWLGQVNWYRFYRTESLLAEMRERIAAARASGVCASSQSRAWMVLEERIARGTVPNEQLRPLLNDALDLRLRVRPRVVLGDPVPYELICKAWILLDPVRFALAIDGLWIDGVPVGRLPQVAAGRQDIRALLTRPIARGTVECSKAGTHTLRCKVRARFWYQPMRLRLQKQEHGPSRLRFLPGKPIPLHEKEFLVEATFEVLEKEPPGYIALQKDPKLAKHIWRWIGAGALEPAKIRGWRETPIDPPPVNLAFEIVARIQGKEYPVGECLYRKGSGRPEFFVRSTDIPPADVGELIFRSSERLARRTVDLYVIWDGRLVFQAVVPEFLRRFEAARR